MAWQRRLGDGDARAKALIQHHDPAPGFAYLVLEGSRACSSEPLDREAVESVEDLTELVGSS